MLVDSHCHLASRQFRDDLDAIIGNAREAGVTRMVTIGTDLEDGPACLEISERQLGVYAAVGVHPCSVTEIEEDSWVDRIRDLAAHEKVAAIGEIGLDYFHPAPDGYTEETYRERQAEFFRAQLELAAKLNLNVVIHQRDRGDQCWNDICEVMEPFHGRLRAVFHCWTTSWETAKPMIDHGHLISFTGIATFKTATDLHACAMEASAGSFMVETDAPYLAPVPHRGKRCEPAHTRHTAEHIANLRQISFEELASLTTETAEQFFRFR